MTCSHTKRYRKKKNDVGGDRQNDRHIMTCFHTKRHRKSQNDVGGDSQNDRHRLNLKKVKDQMIEGLLLSKDKKRKVQAQFKVKDH
jgi:hypothetical protein